jgi:hypothetical protein
MGKDHLSEKKLAERDLQFNDVIFDDLKIINKHYQPGSIKEITSCTYKGKYGFRNNCLQEMSEAVARR